MLKMKNLRRRVLAQQACLIFKVITCHHFGRMMRQRGSGSIVNVISPTCYFDLPYICAYAPARTALLTFSKGLRKELSDQGERVSTVSPPWVETDYFKNNDSDPGWLPRIAKIFPRVTVEQVAEVIHDAALRRDLRGYLPRPHASTDDRAPRNL